MPEPEDHGDPLDGMTILMPGEAPKAEDNVTPAPGASPTGDEDNLKAAYEAAGVTPPTATPAAGTQPKALDAALLEQLKTLDPALVPPDVLERFDRHFQPAFTKKTQALAEEKRAFDRQREEWMQQREHLLDRIGSAKEQPGDKTKLTELREKIRSGDMEAIDQYAEALLDEKMGPMEAEMRVRESWESAATNDPLVGQHAESIRAAFRETPVLRELLATQKFRFAPLVITALARDMELSKAQQYIAGEPDRMKAAVTEAVTKALDAYKAKVRGLPDTTTLAGTSPGAMETKENLDTFEAARAKTRRELAGMGIV